MLGAIVGDIIGSPYEFDPHTIKTTDFPLFSTNSRFTDDTVMTLAVAEGVMTGYGDRAKTEQAIICSMRKYGKRYLNAGFGNRFFTWLVRDNPKPYNSFGNGSAMRVSPVAWAYQSLKDVVVYAATSAQITHSHPEGIRGAVSTAVAIYMARNGASKDEIRKHIENSYGYDFSRTLDNIRPNYHHVESCQESVPEAMTAFFESDSFESTVRNAVSLGGDSDTLAAIAGSIAEAYYGIPDDIQVQALARLDEYLSETYTTFKSWLMACPA
jgi:ADP-ribosylglycohydrolase